MTKNEEARAKRRLDALAKSEVNIHERLHSLRGEFDLISKMLDRVAMAKRPRILSGGAGMSAHAGLVPLKLPRGVIDLVAHRKDRGPR
jgi:hypothetical protein